MSIGTAEQALIEQRVTNEGPSVAAAYFLWALLGMFSGHRFYLGKPGTAILQTLLNFLLVGLIWTFIDAFLIPGMIREKQYEIRQRLAKEMTLPRG